MPDYLITIDDDPIVHRLIAAQTGRPTRPFASARTLLAHPEVLEPMALLVDVNLADGESGIDALPALRAKWPLTPIIVITGGNPNVVGAALAAGANDFLRKPLDPEELVARLKARVAEMQTLAKRDTTQIGPVTLQRTSRTLVSLAAKTPLSDAEAKLLETLAAADGQIVTRDELKQRIWGSQKISDNALNKKVHDLRAALKAHGKLVAIKASYGAGFALVVG